MQVPRLRAWREARALTQVELAERADISARSVAGYEAGHGARPPTVRRLAAALDVSIADLVKEKTADPLADAPQGQSLTAGVSADLRWRVYSNFEHATRRVLEDVPPEDRPLVADQMHQVIDREAELVSR